MSFENETYRILYIQLKQRFESNQTREAQTKVSCLNRSNNNLFPIWLFNFKVVVFAFDIHFWSSFFFCLRLSQMNVPTSLPDQHISSCATTKDKDEDCFEINGPQIHTGRPTTTRVTTSSSSPVLLWLSVVV